MHLRCTGARACACGEPARDLREVMATEFSFQVGTFVSRPWLVAALFGSVRAGVFIVISHPYFTNRLTDFIQLLFGHEILFAEDKAVKQNNTGTTTTSKERVKKLRP